MKAARLLVLTALAALLLPPLAAAQGAFLSDEQPLATLPDMPQGLSFVDGSLYLNVASVLLKAQRQGDNIVGFVADTDFVKIEDDITYVVRQPRTGDLFFTRPDRQGNSCLYYSSRDGKRLKTKRLKMDGLMVEHPTFSADGQVMVFASTERRRSYGGYDLWYSTCSDGEWSSPVNLGNRVNSAGDDLSPCIVGDYLFFSSNGRNESPGHLGIYATRLIARQVTGDTVGMLQIGRSRVQHLPHGINSAVSDCRDFVVDTLSHCCYWVNSASGLRSYAGTLQGITLWGHVYDSRQQPLSGVLVTASLHHRQVALATSGPDGFYRLSLPSLPAGDTYSLTFAKARRFTRRLPLAASHNPSDNLFGEQQRDIVLDSLPIGFPIVYHDLFGPDAVVELSAYGIETLRPLVAFLVDNPALQADLTLSCDPTDNAEFNALLTEQRLLRLQEHLQAALPDEAVLHFHVGKSRNEASGESRLTVLLR